jgi:single-stranded-DNA-specific exonuclease
MEIKYRSKISEEAWPNVHPLIQRLYQSRGVELGQHQIELSALLPYNALKDIDKACNLLAEMICAQKKILVIGDFDADGATASALAVSALRAFGALNVDFLVPNRFDFGYGLSVGIVDLAALSNPDLIVTVDNGISNIEGVARAKELGISVLITDHHLAADVLPNADAIVNPNQTGCDFPSKAIAGVGVIFYVMCGLRKTLIERGWFANQDVPNMAQFLDLVALGTVADVVPLDRNNRIMIQHGIQRLKNGLGRPGIVALLEVCGRSLNRLKANDFGFAVGPRLNAAGRLEDMSLGINCLLASNLLEALPMARQLDFLNTERRQIESQMQSDALKIMDELYGDFITPAGICLYHPNWHQGVIGILASRMKDRFSKPACIFAKASETEFKASLRSVVGLNIRDILASIAQKHPHLMKKFGGHAMAAGLSIAPEHFAEFKAVFEAELESHAHETDLSIWSDGALGPLDLSLETASLIEKHGPWGQMFPEPVFDNIFEVLEQRIVGQNHLKMTLQLKDSHLCLDAILFNVDLEQWPNHRARLIHAVYHLDINEYQGRKRLQLMIKNMKEYTQEFGED